MKLCGEIYFLIISKIYQKLIDLFINNLNSFKKDINSQETINQF